MAKADTPKTKFYDFDDLLINGEYKKPQIMYIDDQSKVRFERLLKLYKNFLKNLQQTEKDSFTDDASVVEAMGKEVHHFKGDRTNIKLTTPEDFIFAEALLNRPQSI